MSTKKTMNTSASENLGTDSIPSKSIINPDQWRETPEFKRAWWMTEDIPGSFTKLNAATYYALAMEMPKDARIVEVGVDQGRSMSMMLQGLYKRQSAKVCLVDSWESVLIDNKAKVEKMIKQFDDDGQLKVHVMHMKSEDAGRLVENETLDLVHIDGCHYSPVIDLDLDTWCPKIKVGGYLAMHDCKATFPDVDRCVEEKITSNKSWRFVGIWDSLAVWRRV